MDYNQVILLQKRFVRFHRLIFFMLALYQISAYMGITKNDFIYQTLGLFIILLSEIVVMNQKPVKLKWLTFVKYAYVFVTVLFLAFTKQPFAFGIATMCLLLFCFELLLTTDFTDGYVRKGCIGCLLLPLITGLIFMYFYSTWTYLSLLSYVVSDCFFVVMFSAFADEFASIMKENEEKVFAQTRLIERINETNEELRIHQEKVKSTNELLGVQKIELQSAYIKINSVNEEMRIQNEILKYISSSFDIEKLMGFITEAFVKRMGVDVSAILLKPGITNNRDRMYKIHTILGKEFEACIQKALESGEIEGIIEDRKIYQDNYVKENSYDFLNVGVIQSVLVVPLIKQDEQIGVLFVGHGNRGYFHENVEFYEGIMSQFLIALNNANLYQEMQAMAVLDGLTGIYNRRHLTKIFNQYMYESINKRTPLSAALFDIDFFKKINDTYGHLFGDEIIKTIASLAKSISEEYDGIAARYGGEEFVIIFPNKGRDEAYPAVEKLHSEVKKLGIEHHGKRVMVNVSVGFTSFPSTCKDPRELLNRADWSMYYSKQHGRDQITIDSDEIQKAVALE